LFSLGPNVVNLPVFIAAFPAAEVESVCLVESVVAYRTGYPGSIRTGVVDVIFTYHIRNRVIGLRAVLDRVYAALDDCYDCKDKEQEEHQNLENKFK
jgi:hypothetical protein